jgi:tetratricopeptide (TPR) repeat protein
MMKRILTITIALAMTGCAELRTHMPSHSNKNPYEGRIFYTKYLNPQASQLDAQIQRDLDTLRANPNAASVHNDLGAALLQKGFPKDAEVEFERAVDSDRRFYPAWYNLGLVRAARGDSSGSAFAFGRTVHYKPGHALALFQLGLVAEHRGNKDDAIEYYAKALSINHQLLDVRVNPRILDSQLIDLALIRMYPLAHSRQSMQFFGAPAGYSDAQPQAPASKKP